jgi:predicted transcriptional regulator
MKLIGGLDRGADPKDSLTFHAGRSTRYPRGSSMTDSKGRLRTGDPGRIDEDGHSFLVGRSSEMIESAGERIFPREIEDAEVIDSTCIFPPAIGLCANCARSITELREPSYDVPPPVMPTDPPRPTEAESEILAVLWERGPSTVREVHEALPDRGTGYTTVLKLMQIMAHKRLVVRDESRRSHVYAPTVEQGAMQRRWLDELRERAFSGSTSALVLGALSSKRASAEELQEIRALLDRLEHDDRDAGGER